MISTRPIPPYHRRTVPRPKPQSQTAVIRPGDKISRKTNWQLDKDWRTDILLDSQPRSMPIRNGISGISLIDRLASPVDRQLCAPNSLGREVDLEDLVSSGVGKRAKRATTATTLGYDFIPDPTITPIPDWIGGTEPVIAKAIPRASALMEAVEGDNTPLAGTPRTPSLIPPSLLDMSNHTSKQVDEEEDEDEDEDDEWERVSTVSDVRSLSATTNAGDEDDLGSVIILGEMEIEDPLYEYGIRQKDEKLQGKVSYAAALGEKKR